MKKIKHKFINLVFIFMLSIIPLISFAQLGPDDDPNAYQDFINSNSNNTTSSNSAISGLCSIGQDPKIDSIFNYMLCVIYRSIVPLIFGLATLLFVWGVVKFMLNTDNEGEREKGKQFIIWGIIALAVMTSIWGLVSLLGGSFGLDTNYIPSVRPN